MSNLRQVTRIETTNIIQCPYCKTLIEPWDYIETGDMDGEFTIECENEACKNSISVKFKTDIRFEATKQL